MVARVEDLAGLPDWPRMLSAAQAAAYLGVSPPTLARLRLPVCRIGGRVLFDRRQLDAWADAQAARAGVPDFDEALDRLDG